jgi:thymidylate kinase
MTPLQTGQKGSKILLTTRMQSVADMDRAQFFFPFQMDRAQLVVNQKLNGLDEDNSLVLFKRHTFSRN